MAVEFIVEVGGDVLAPLGKTRQRKGPEVEAGEEVFAKVPSVTQRARSRLVPAIS
jgi:hypothetical protein